MRSGDMLETMAKVILWLCAILWLGMVTLLFGFGISAFAQTIIDSAGGGSGIMATKVLSAASTNATSVKAYGGSLYQVIAINTTVTPYYLKFYDKASAPTCNSDTVVQSYPIAASSTVSLPILMGLPFKLGIGLCLTGALADNDNTNAATGVTINLLYK